jgi:micrococcal nuclease
MGGEGGEHSARTPRVTVPVRTGRHLWLGGVLLMLLTLRLLTGRSAVIDAADDHFRYHDRSFRVVSMVDGDTLDLEAPDGDRAVTRVRLWGVDAPEIAHPPEPAAYFGDEAHRFAERMLDKAIVHVVLAPHDTRGKYGRLLAYVQLERGGEMFNEMLLREGLAYADTRFDHPYRRTFVDIERRARRTGTGLWAGVEPAQMPPWRKRRESLSD